MCKYGDNLSVGEWFVIMKELLRFFFILIVVSSAHLHLQAPCFDVLALWTALFWADRASVVLAGDVSWII